MLGWIVKAGVSAAALLAMPSMADEAARMLVDESRQLATQIVTQVRSELIKELERTGPLRAITVCKYSVPEITSNMSRQTGMRVTRVSLRPRNKALGDADAWEQKVLLDFEKRATKGEKVEGLEYHELVVEPVGRYFRYMKAIAMMPACMTCHGPQNQLSEGVRAQLAAEYPFDKAIDYQLGQVRGAVSVKRLLNGKD